MQGKPYTDIDYCKYGMPYRKRTRLWNNFQGRWEGRPLCKRDCGNIREGTIRHNEVAQRSPKTKEDREWREEIDPIWSKLLDMPLLSPRYAMQYLATELFRNHFHPDIWLKVVENQLNKYENIVISDCRFTNEINMIQKYGGKIIHVHRNIPSWFYRYQQGEEVEYIKNIHISEYQWIRTHKDYIIENNTSIEDLIKNINEIYIPLKKV
jgi:hypothetical protein